MNTEERTKELKEDVDYYMSLAEKRYIRHHADWEEVIKELDEDEQKALGYNYFILNGKFFPELRQITQQVLMEHAIKRKKLNKKRKNTGVSKTKISFLTKKKIPKRASASAIRKKTYHPKKEGDLK